MEGEEEERRRAERAMRFYGGVQPQHLQPIRRSIGQSREVLGTSSQLEKQYLRLTADPDPTTVRPPPVLRRSLKHVLRRWADGAEYSWCANQLKAIRQDLVVQRVEDELAIDVYETNARLAIHQDDAAEYNQCQSVLKHLFGKLPGLGHRQEFASYELLWQLSVNSKPDLTECVQRISRGGLSMIGHPAVKLALNVTSAVNTNNWHLFFKLRRQAASFEVSAALISRMLPAVRRRALGSICAAFRPSIPLAVLAERLGFDRLDECERFLAAEAVRVEQGTVVLSAGGRAAPDGEKAAGRAPGVGEDRMRPKQSRKDKKVKKPKKKKKAKKRKRSDSSD